VGFLPLAMAKCFAFASCFQVPDFFKGTCFFQPNRSYLIVAEESGYARFELFLSSQSISVCDFVVFSSPGARIRGTGVQPIRKCLAGLRQKVWPALLGLP
jgi:hypothetical protein